jgi:hypothetical protein
VRLIAVRVAPTLPIPKNNLLFNTREGRVLVLSNIEGPPRPRIFSHLHHSGATGLATAPSLSSTLKGSHSPARRNAPGPRDAAPTSLDPVGIKLVFGPKSAAPLQAAGILVISPTQTFGLHVRSGIQTNNLSLFPAVPF